MVNSNSFSLQVEFIHPNAQLPKYEHVGDSGMDLFSVEDVVIPSGVYKLVRTGIKICLPVGTEAQIRPKSGIALKNSVTVVNTPGTIDASYRGEIGVILINHGKEPYVVSIGSKIAQMVIVPVICVDVVKVDNIEMCSTRGEGGFGSTGL